MKAVILERRGTDAAVLTENGTFMKIRHPGTVGDEIEIAGEGKPHIRILRSAVVKTLAAAALIIAVIGGSYHYMAVSVSAYVSIDAGGRSVELSVNRLGRVTSVAYITDGESGLAETISRDVGGKRVEDAVSAVLDRLTETADISSQDEPMIVGITSDSENQAESLETAIKNNVPDSVYTVRVSGDEREEAHKQDIGGGKYVYGNKDAVADTGENEDDASDESEMTETAEPDIIPVIETEQPFTGTEEAATNAVPPMTGVPDTEGAVSAPPPNEQFYGDDTRDDRQGRQEAPASDTTEPPKPDGQISGEAPPEVPTEQHDAQAAPVPGTEPPQPDGQFHGDAPDDVPPDRQNGQNEAAFIPGEGPGMPQYGTYDIPANDMRYGPDTKNGDAAPPAVSSGVH